MKPLFAPRSTRSFGASSRALSRPAGIAVLECKRLQCARILYFIIARQLTVFLPLIVGPAITWALSAFKGSHAGHIIGAFDDGIFDVLFVMPEAVSLTPEAGSPGDRAGENTQHMSRGCLTVEPVLMRYTGHIAASPRHKKQLSECGMVVGVKTW